MKKKTIIVTGGSKGIGRSICLSFADPKNFIGFTYHNDLEGAKKTAKILERNRCHSYYQKVDVSSFDEIKVFFNSIIKKTGEISVLVNNAGTIDDALLPLMKKKSWDKVIDVNLSGTFYCTKIASRQMIKQKYGRIINISSIVGIMGNYGQSNYSASKAGIIALTKTNAKELAKLNITVNSVAPGYILTEMIKKNNSKKYIKNIPLGRLGAPEDVSNVVHFLASNKASYITGQTINVDGGLCT